MLLNQKNINMPNYVKESNNLRFSDLEDVQCSAPKDCFQNQDHTLIK